MAATAMFVATRLPKQWLWGRRTVFVLCGAVLATAVMELLVKSSYSTDQMPNLLWLMFLPLALSIGLLVASWRNRHRWLKWPAVATVIMALLFSATLVNDYYAFFPTFYSLFSADTRRLLNEQNTTTTLQYSVSSKATTASLEGQLFGGNATTVGRVHSVTIPGTISGFKPRPEWVYTPAIADGVKELSLPVVVLLPGYPGLTYNWLGGGLKATMDHFAATHHGITPLVFMVDNTGSLANDTECVDSPRGNIETYLTQDVPNYIKSHYKVSGDPSHWAIGGLSMGGMCSVMLALRHPAVYHYFLDFSGETGPEVGSRARTVAELFGGSEMTWQQHQPFYLLAHNEYRNMGGFFAVGNDDKTRLISGMKALYEKTGAAGIESRFEEVGGRHTYHVWEQGFKDALPWLSNRLGATACAGSCSS